MARLQRGNLLAEQAGWHHRNSTRVVAGLAAFGELLSSALIATSLLSVLSWQMVSATSATADVSGAAGLILALLLVGSANSLLGFIHATHFFNRKRSLATKRPIVEASVVALIVASCGCFALGASFAFEASISIPNVLLILSWIRAQEASCEIDANGPTIEFRSVPMSAREVDRNRITRASGPSSLNFSSRGPGTNRRDSSKPSPRKSILWAAAIAALLVTLFSVIGMTSVSSSSDSTLASSGDSSSGDHENSEEQLTGLTSCAEHFIDMWGPGLASKRGLRYTRVSLALAMTNNSFDSPTDTPRYFMETAYQTTSNGAPSTSYAQRKMTQALNDETFSRCHEQYKDLSGKTPDVLQLFACRETPGGPFPIDCE